MARFLRTALIVAELLCIPIAGWLIALDDDPSDWMIMRLGVSYASAAGGQLNPRQFRFRIPRASELRDLIPKHRLSSSMQDVRLMTGPHQWRLVA